jgi:hypothetical protein
MVGRTDGPPISVIVCHWGKGIHRSTATREFLSRTSAGEIHEVLDVLGSDLPGVFSQNYSFSDFILFAEKQAAFDHVLLIGSAFRISMHSILILQKAHIVRSAHLSIPRVTGAMDCRAAAVRIWLERKLQASKVEVDEMGIDCRLSKFGRCEAIFMHRSDAFSIVKNVSFTTARSGGCYAKIVGECVAQTVIDSVVFS